MSNQQRIQIIILNAINFLRLDDKAREKINDLWRLYLRLYEHDSDQCVEEMETFIQELYNMSNRTQPSMLNAINQKINSVEREINGNVFNGGLKKRKTGKKRKRTTYKTTKKRSKKRRKTIKGGKDLTALYLNKKFPLYDENTSRNQEIHRQEIQRQRQEQEERRRQEEQELRQQQAESERRKQAEAEKQRQEEADRIQREKDFWDKF